MIGDLNVVFCVVSRLPQTLVNEVEEIGSFSHET